MLPPVVSTGEFYAPLKTTVHNITGINNPHYLAFHGNGDTFVTCYGDNCVSVYDSSGTRKATIGKRGTGDLEFEHPYGMPVLIPGHFLIGHPLRSPPVRTVCDEEKVKPYVVKKRSSHICGEEKE